MSATGTFPVAPHAPPTFILGITRAAKLSIRYRNSLDKMFSCRPLPSMLTFLIASITHTQINAFSFFCSNAFYSAPAQQDCYRALADFPLADGYHRYFVEQQMRAAWPTLDWEAWTDPRPVSRRQKAEQIPKFWSVGMTSSYRAETDTQDRPKSC